MFLFATSVALQNLVRAVVSSSVYMCLHVHESKLYASVYTCLNRSP